MLFYRQKNKNNCSSNYTITHYQLAIFFQHTLRIIWYGIFAISTQCFKKTLYLL